MEFDTILNMTGKRLTLALSDGTRLVIEPGPKVARLHHFTDPASTKKTVKLDSHEIEIEEFEEPMVENLPIPRKGVLIVVKEEIAKHRRVRGRNDVYYPSNKEGMTSTGLRRG
jgi:hypothetical protein